MAMFFTSSKKSKNIFRADFHPPRILIVMILLRLHMILIILFTKLKRKERKTVTYRKNWQDFLDKRRKRYSRKNQWKLSTWEKKKM